MVIYRVGGAVRDRLLNLPVDDQDWVVTGSSPTEMLAKGYRQVGRHFPVFLHPDTHEEYALARTERKIAPGYGGFQVHTDPDVTLEDDLRRRDLTINAMAETDDGELIDPYGGCDDLKQRILRHVSPAFSEDPVRILRVARFAARFKSLGFSVAPETCELMHALVKKGEVATLTAERVWAEMERALGEENPTEFFKVLRDCHALEVLFPEIDCLYGIPQRPEYHPEIDTGLHTMMVLEQAVHLSQDIQVRFAALVHDLGKGTTPKSLWPSHTGHEKRSVKLIQGLCKRLRIPNRYRDLAIGVARYHTHCHRAAELRPDTLLKTLESLDVFRRPERLDAFLLTCEADARGRLGLEKQPYPQAIIFRDAYRKALSIEPRTLVEQGLQGLELAAELRRLRINAISNGTEKNDPDID